jgi:hypothetical protein
MTIGHWATSHSPVAQLPSCRYRFEAKGAAPPSLSSSMQLSRAHRSRRPTGALLLSLEAVGCADACRGDLRYDADSRIRCRKQACGAAPRVLLRLVPAQSRVLPGQMLAMDHQAAAPGEPNFRSARYGVNFDAVLLVALAASPWPSDRSRDNTDGGEPRTLTGARRAPLDSVQAPRSRARPGSSGRPVVYRLGGTRAGGHSDAGVRIGARRARRGARAAADRVRRHRRRPVRRVGPGRWRCLDSG